jgi:hypothetical protein
LGLFLSSAESLKVATLGNKVSRITFGRIQEQQNGSKIRGMSEPVLSQEQRGLWRRE